MLDRLKTANKVVGMKQLRRAVRDGLAETVFLAEDADPRLRDEVRQLCRLAGTTPVCVKTMKELGSACGIRVGAAAAATIRAAND